MSCDSIRLKTKDIIGQRLRRKKRVTEKLINNNINDDNKSSKFQANFSMGPGVNTRLSSHAFPESKDFKP